MSDCIDLTSDTEDFVAGFRGHVEISSDVELVEDEPVAAEAVAAAVPADELGDDLVITKALGEVATIDYPHSRCDCGQHPFVTRAAASNALFCNNCYCFVCDVKASECPVWGTGASSKDHCHAYAYPSWQALRKERRNGGPAKQQAIAQTSTTAVGRLLPHSGQTTLLTERTPQPYSGPSAAPCRATLPNPAESPEAFELGTIRLPCQAVGGNTIATLQARLNRFGYYYDPNDPMDLVADDGSLSLSNLFKTAYDSGSRQGVYCKLHPVVDSDLAGRDFLLYVRQVTIVHYDGREPPMTYGVKVRKTATSGDLLQEVEKLLAFPLAANECLKLVHMSASIHDLSAPWRAQMYENLDDKLESCNPLQNRGFWVYRVLKPQVPTPMWGVVFHRLLPQAAVAVPTSNVNVGIPFLVPMSPSDIHGGPHANTLVVRAVAAYMRCFSRDNSLQSSIQVFRHESGGWVGKPPSSASFSRHRDSILTRSARTTVLNLVVGWKKAPPIPSMAAFNTPPVHASASPEVLRETQHQLEEDAAFENQRFYDAELPYRVVDQLKHACRCTAPKPANRPAKEHYAIDPLMACELTLEPVPGSTMEGIACIKVYTWRKTAVGRRSLLQDFEVWGSSSMVTIFNVADALHLLARQTSEAGRKMVLSICREEWSGRHRIQGMKGLFDSLKERDLAPAAHPDGLTVKLQHHQLQSLRFLQEMEDCEGGFRGRFWLPLKAGTSSYWYSPLFERICLDIPPQACGGFLAEEMGLGKTVEILALMASRPPPPSKVAGVESVVDGVPRFASRATLVVCAVSLAGQWMMEAQSKLSVPLRAHLYHGNRAETNPYKLATQYDLVVTTYGMIRQDCPLQKVNWFRLVFDESHTLKQATTKQTQGCSALVADRRWLCSGTPFTAGLGDLYGQLVAMKMAPLDKKSVFDSLMKPSLNHFHGADMTKAFNILSNLMVRHTKDQVSKGEHAMQLPPKKQEDVAVVPTETELTAYKNVFKLAKSCWLRHKALGTKHIMTHLFTIMALLQPLRRICSGGDLTSADLEVNTTISNAPDAIPSDSSLVVPEDVECSVCLDNMEAPVCTPCRHWFCQECITSCLNNSGKCPMCRTEVSVSGLRAGVVAAPEIKDGASSSRNVTVCNSKLRTLLHELTVMQQQRPGAKALVFTQYKSSVLWLQRSLDEHGFLCSYITGDMTARKREKAIEAFQTSTRTAIFLLSMRTGAVGINLTAANFVFIMEPFLNPALELQAVGRAWRMGQQRHVTVKRLYIQGSVEQRIIDVAKQKSSMDAATRQAGAAVAALQAAADDEDPDEAIYHMMTGIPAKRARQQTGIVGNLTTDKQSLRLEELNMLFEEPTFPPPLPAGTSVRPVALQPDAGTMAGLAMPLQPATAADMHGAGAVAPGPAMPAGSTQLGTQAAAGPSHPATAVCGNKRVYIATAAHDAERQVRPKVGDAQAGFSEAGVGDKGATVSIPGCRGLISLLKSIQPPSQL